MFARTEVLNVYELRLCENDQEREMHR
jgi:hypothetical protein